MTFQPGANINTQGFGNRPETVEVPHIDTRDPLPSDYQYPIGKTWVNKQDESVWVLVNFISVGPILEANWIAISSATAVIDFVEDIGSATPLANTLNVLGGAHVVTTGSGNTITIDAAGSIATDYVEDSGSATASGGILNIVGSGTVTTSGSGNTITIDSPAVTATNYVEDIGSATPSGNILNIVGSSTILTSGVGNTVTIDTHGIVTTDYVEDSGSAMASVGILNIVGAGSVTTSGAGNTITITGNNGGTSSAFMAFLSSDVPNVTGDSTVYQVIFDTVSFDTSSAYNNVTGVFTAPTTGYYAFQSCLFCNISSAIHAITSCYSVLVTTSQSYQMQFIPSQSAGIYKEILSGSIIVPMTAGDTANISVIANGGGSGSKNFGFSSSNTAVLLPAGVATYFSGVRVF